MIKQQSTEISAKSTFGPRRAVIPAKRLLGGQVKAFIGNRGRRTLAKTANLETITAMADQCLTQWVSQAKPHTPTKAPALINFIFGDGYIFEMGHIFLAQSSLSFIMFKINL